MLGLYGAVGDGTRKKNIKFFAVPIEATNGSHLHPSAITTPQRSAKSGWKRQPCCWCGSSTCTTGPCQLYDCILCFFSINLLEIKRCGMFREREAVLCHRQCSPTFQDHQLSRPQTQRQCLGARQVTQASIPEKNTWMLHQNLSCPTLINYPPVNLRAGGGRRKVV